MVIAVQASWLLDRKQDVRIASSTAQATWGRWFYEHLNFRGCMYVCTYGALLDLLAYAAAVVSVRSMHVDMHACLS